MKSKDYAKTGTYYLVGNLFNKGIAFLTIIMMPFAYSIADGIAFGVLSYIGVKAFSGKVKEISIPTWIIGVVFVLKFILIH